jgi:hypothetical protein
MGGRPATRSGACARAALDVLGIVRRQRVVSRLALRMHGWQKMMVARRKRGLQACALEREGFVSGGDPVMLLPGTGFVRDDEVRLHSHATRDVTLS